MRTPVNVHENGSRSTEVAGLRVPERSYEQVRDQVSDGDILLFDGRYLISRVVKRLTGGAFSHCGLVLTWNGRRMLVHADMNGGVQTLLLSQALQRYRAGIIWLQLRPSARQRLDVEALRKEAQAHLGMAYGVWSVLHAGAHVHLGLPPPGESPHPRAPHCSAFVARCFRKAGTPLVPKSDNLVTPGDIARSLALKPQGLLRRASANER